MPNKSISFNEEILKAILDGRKTQTRRPHVEAKYQVDDIVQVENSNIVIKIIGVRKEQLQDITEQDAIAEGFNINNAYIAPIGKPFALHWFENIWNLIYGNNESKQWESNPYVQVYEFERI